MRTRWWLVGCLALSLLGGALAQSPWIDVSVGVQEGKTPIYSGDPGLKTTWAKSLDRGDVANVSALELGAHTGTHIDAPLHFIPGGKPIDQVPLDVLMGKATVLDCGPDATVIDAKLLGTLHWQGATRILFKTRNSYRKLYDDPTFHTDFTAIAPDAAKLLADGGVKLVGIDYNSVEIFGAKAPLTHRTLLGKDIVIVEGLDLRSVNGGVYDLIVLPIKLVGREAAPARALLRSL